MLTNASRRIVTLMAFAVVFSVVSVEIKAVNKANQPNTPPSTGAAGVLSAPAKVIFGGTIAAALLSFLAEAGGSFEDYAVGLAAVAAGTAMLVNGGPVWQALNNVIGSTPSTTPTGNTKPTGSTTSLGVAA